MGVKSYDFAGWATRNNIPCSDGRTIRHGAFKECDGTEVPLVWNHDHGGPDAVLGHAYLEHRDEGVYCYGSFNNTENGRDAKELVKNGDVTSLSIYANRLKQHGGDVIHGVIREVSLVLAGANPGAKIETVLCHGDGEEYEESAVIKFDENVIDELSHADEEPEKPAKEEEEKMADEAKKPETEGGDETVKEVFDTLSEKQKTAVYAIIGEAVKNAKNSEGGDEEMKHNAFDAYEEDAVLQHNEEALRVIIADGKRFGSLKESFLAHADEYGITNIDYLFPDAKAMEDTPGFIKRTPEEWVSVVLNGIHHTPFSRTKSLFADITEDEARARGYIKGNKKKDEVFSLLKRTTNPTTIYKKQKLDRDDIIDITDFNVVAWLKTEMRMMLDEEIARAVLFGDGRLSSSDDKIDEQCIRPAISDADLYTITANVGTAVDDGLVDNIVLALADYQGSGNTIAFLGVKTVTRLLLIKDADGHRLYKTIAELANAMGVNRIVKVPDSIIPTGFFGLILDLSDYNAGADKGGSINMFDDFDIDYNQQKYLMEGRMSGALRKPKSAVALKAAVAEEVVG